GDGLSRRLHPEVGEASPLDDGEERLLRPLGLCRQQLAEARTAAIEPGEGPPRRLLRQPTVGLTRRTMVERHDDVRPEGALDLHYPLGREEVPRTVDMAAELHPVVADGADIRE